MEEVWFSHCIAEEFIGLVWSHGKTIGNLPEYRLGNRHTVGVWVQAGAKGLQAHGACLRNGRSGEVITVQCVAI